MNLLEAHGMTETDALRLIKQYKVHARRLIRDDQDRQEINEASNGFTLPRKARFTTGLKGDAPKEYCTFRIQCNDKKHDITASDAMFLFIKIQKSTERLEM